MEASVGGQASEPLHYIGYPAIIENLFNNEELNLAQCIDESLKCLDLVENIRYHHSYTP